MKYNIDPQSQSYDTWELHKALEAAGVVFTGVSGHGNSSFIVHCDTEENAAVDVVVQAHLAIDWKLEAAKEEKRNEIRGAFNTESMLPVTVTVNLVDYTFNGGMDSALRIDGAFRMAQRIGELDVTLSDIDNVNHVFALADADIIAQAIAIAFRALFLKKQGKMVDITNAVDHAALNLITW